MKKFVFTNEKYQSIKQKEYDALKRRLQNVDKEIEALADELRMLEKKFQTERESFNQACREGIRAEQLRAYQWYFPYLEEQRAALEKKRLALEAQRKKLREELVSRFNELKVLDEMREEQYAAYLKEVAADEAKELDSFLSYTIYEGAV